MRMLLCRGVCSSKRLADKTHISSSTQSLHREKLCHISRHSTMATDGLRIKAHPRRTYDNAAPLKQQDKAVLRVQYQNDVDIIDIGLDDHTFRLTPILRQYCDQMRNNMFNQELEIIGRGHVLLFTAFLFDHNDVRNNYFRLDRRSQWRFPTFRSLLSAADLQTSRQIGQPPTILVYVESSESTNAELYSFICADQPYFRSWRIYGAAKSHSVRPVEQVITIDDNRNLYIGVPAIGQARVSLEPSETGHKERIELVKDKLYSRAPHPKLTFQPHESILGVAPATVESPLVLSVRLINHLQIPELKHVTLPPQAWIQIIPPKVPARRIKTALIHALNQKNSDLDAGKQRADPRRVGRLFEDKSGKKWDVELWIMPQGRNMQYFHRYESNDLAGFCSPGWSGLHAEAHFIPSGLHHTRQSDIPRIQRPTDSDSGISEREQYGLHPGLSENPLVSVSEHESRTVRLYGYGENSTTVVTSQHRQRLLPSDLNWATRHYEQFFWVDLAGPDNDDQSETREPDTTGTRSATLRSIFGRRYLVKDYNNHEPRYNFTGLTSGHPVKQDAKTYHIGINIINSLHALSLDDVHIPPILIRTQQPAAITTNSIANQILTTLEQHALQEPEGDLGRLHTIATKEQWRVQIWYLPQGKDSGIMCLPGDTAWDRFLGDEHDTLYVEAHVMPVVVGIAQSALSTAQKTIVRSDTRTDVAELIRRAGDSGAGNEENNEDNNEEDFDDGLFVSERQGDQNELDRIMAAVNSVEDTGTTDDQELLTEQRLREELIKQARSETQVQPSQSLGHMFVFGEASTYAEQLGNADDDRSAKEIRHGGRKDDVDAALGSSFFQEREEECEDDWEDVDEDAGGNA
ncbi:hypothetical protein DOTSEDRAFT_31515 [Dothistroma septosporum NZE10]|uniref:Uncharacterized protein n=1 Tax=Dothistroma septosporum (strain NZE10 / CBS 128990) TaxID=675120 RepID=N1PUD5_DOTSN|nr:hypothetical protein DOTSEDRAFT_31515 [Dothistroma septosporum NZE10]